MPWEDDVPAWSGVVGKTLQDAALGFSQALLDMPKERRAAEKEELDLIRQRSQIAYDKARAESEARRYQGDRYLKTGWELYDLHDIDPVTNKPRVVSTKPPTAGKPDSTLEMRRKHVIESYEQVFGVPFQEWARAGVFSHPRYGEFTDAFAGRGDIRIGPDGAVIYMPQARAAAQGQPQSPTGTVAPPGEKPTTGEKPVEPTKPVTAPATLRDGLQRVADNVGARLEDLERVISFETGGTFATTARNGRSGATGYIQFTPGTAERMGTTTDAIAKMTPEEQLALVERYLRPYRGRIDNLQDLYLAIFAPAAIGKGSNEVLYSQKDHPKAYEQNIELDRDKKGYITVADATAAVMRHGGTAPSQETKPTATPAPTPQARAVPEKPAEKPLPGTPTAPLVANPDTVGWQLKQWQQKAPELVDKEMELHIKSPATATTPADLLARVEAYRQLRGTDPPGWAEHPLARRIAAGQGAPAQPPAAGAPPTSSVPQVAAPVPPEGGAGQPPAATPNQISVPQVRTDAQKQADRDKADEQARKRNDETRDNEEHGLKFAQWQLNVNADQRAQWMQERLAKLDKSQHPTVDQARIANHLWTLGEVRPETMGFWPDLDPFEKAKVNAIQQEPLIAEEKRKEADFLIRQQKENRADRGEHLTAMGKVQPYFQEIGALDTAEYLTTQIIPLLETKNIGLWGALSGYEQAIGSIAGYRRNQFLTQIDKQLQTAGLNPNIDTTARKLALTNAIETTDPKIRQQYRMISPQSRVQTLSSLLIYAHAMAAKRVAGGTERGLIGTDMAHAEKLFDPSLWYSNPDQLLANLQELQGFIHQARPKLDEMITAHHINPKTKLLIKRDYEDKPGALPATQIPPAPQVTPQAQDQHMQILQGG